LSFIGFAVSDSTFRIAASSRREAMDWSLVLVSQEIDASIEYSEAGWELVVPWESQQQAEQAIQLYQEENRRWPLQQEILAPGLLFDWTSLAWVFLLALFFWLNNHTGIDLRSGGIVDATAVARGEWWRVFTGLWLHADLSHLAMNAVFGFILLGFVMGRFGTMPGLTAAYLSGALGNALVLGVVYRPRLSLGASGMVMGCLGLLAMQTFDQWFRDRQFSKPLIRGLFGGIMLFALLGLSPGTDIFAHAAGFSCGLVLGCVLTFLPVISRKPLAHFLSGALFAALVVYPWWLALRPRL